MTVAARATPLRAWHLAQGARMVEFADWELPLHYGSQLAEHAAVREAAGLFDVSHMRPLDVSGPQARDFLRYALANDVARLDGQDGKALYTVMVQEDGGILDDLIVTRRTAREYRLVLNAARAESDTVHLRCLARRWAGSQRAAPEIQERPDLGILACQGPMAARQLAAVLDFPELLQRKPFSTLERDQLFLSRTGYTGEDGFEIIAPGDRLLGLADALVAAGVKPAGLAARDSLRLEAGLNLYGQDMTVADSPARSNLDWTVDLRDPEREFLGRSALAAERAQGARQALRGLILKDGIARAGCAVSSREGLPLGQVTSGLFAPSLRRGIALARLTSDTPLGATVFVSLRGREHVALVVQPPFWRRGRPCHDVEERIREHDT
ncbi:glycine cleavage system aminomethyltransferase GcvT [Acidithiobacillus caldus]|jgi:aminomethyltransferase|uniref:aminomethyltransferase n=3 Tax=Acidithiobacillus caldus TaxID=33059 RepID=F9ZLM5_ACICS|nr:glycine cleavage system aminomethyltransferase GcvT [Acidithiobacillus caldus]AEK57560.1 Aminomethyltransferase (glycine cleavage system T protein) [Acidithiobacillus caldus SM-1]AUW32259.1 glycine cleavage system aminomethyltransferase GcvT [Acidithiobacillus caldus]MBU2791778.1 glycine cleavage system aminomethyltransferase GcvT [Acidithiobacillus caldus]MBU2820441.1 glycine cleavage system aminomethyltransferase GcvT [Acidithiobacillus caldus]OFC32336.1 glycine cleavage system protein T 